MTSRTKTVIDNKSTRLIYKTNIVVIGAGQAGLSSAFYLKKMGLKPGKDFVILDKATNPGGAWQYRWPSLTLSTVNGIHDLPGMSFQETVPTGNPREVHANVAVPRYFECYEKTFGLTVFRPVAVSVVCNREVSLRVETDRGTFSTKGIINATGTWDTPYIPEYPGASVFKGQQLHTKDYQRADDFKGKHVLIVGSGISAIQLLDEISQVTRTTWVTRRVPRFNEGSFDAEKGRAAVAIVEDRVRRGLPAGSVVSVTGLPVTPAIIAMRKRGVLDRKPMFTEITEEGVRMADGSLLAVDIILWCTGFRSSLDHLMPLLIREENGGIVMGGRLATMVSKDPRIHLVGYGPSASTIGANRAGRAAAQELAEHLGLAVQPK
ncbi:NAD(P)-binding domain-containing protein [Sphingobacterium sp. JB170]|uniref:NAD(P)-binding domain-containing protein n=1 Tax=Sphingobacterium sp. JB170 TaxID=1434842 RepID=UPI00097F657D|nr:NAD(P)-binding domain-containing protein [Sphingobacterium sp. JB170]SJN42067.1 L-fuco-beta-pyranose dehydrogenase [Sphingobacterium sp. JB170]